MTQTEGVVLVTGATGSVGRYVAKALETAGAPVRRALMTPTGNEAGDVVRFDFSDRSSWDASLAGVDRIFLMRPPAIADVKGVIRPFVRAAARRQIRNVSVLSLMGVNPAMPHWQLEKDVKASGMPWTMLRPAFFMQNLETAYRDDILQHDRIRLPAGNGRTSFVDTRDVAAVAAKALGRPAEHAGQAYTLTGPVALPWSHVASVLSAELGRPIRYEPIGLLTARRELKAAGLPGDYVNVQLMINVVARIGLAAKVNGDVARLLRRPPGTIEEYVNAQRKLWLTQ